MGIFSPRAQHHADQSVAAGSDGDYKEAYHHFKELQKTSKDPVRDLARAALADRDGREN